MKKLAIKIGYLVVSVALIVCALIYMPGHDLININGDNAANKETVREEDHRIIVGDGTAALAYKNETVYVVLNADGTVADQRVVNWIYDMDNKSLNTLVDYGHYTSVTNMKSEKVPVVNDDHVIWDQDSLDEGDIFYEGTTSQELPIDIEISYRLDGQELSASEVVGRSGHLKIIINVENRLKENGLLYYTSYEGERVAEEDENCVPMVVQGSYTIDSKKFSDISATNGAQVVVGETINLGFMAFPLPDTEIEIDMQGEDIELNPITLTIMPQMPPIPNIDMEEDLLQMLDGVNQIGSGLMQIYDGLSMMLDEFENFRVMAMEMAEEMTAFLEDNRELIEAIEDLLGNISRDDLEKLLDRIKELPDLPDELDDIIDKLPDDWPDELPDLPDDWPDELPDLPDDWPDELPDLPDDWPDFPDLPAEALGINDELSGDQSMGGGEMDNSEITGVPDSNIEQEKEVNVAENGDEQDLDDPVEGVSDEDEGDEEADGPENTEPEEDDPPANDDEGETDRDEQIEDTLESIRDNLNRIDFDQIRRDLDRFKTEMEDVFADLPEALNELVNAPRMLADGIKEIHDRGIVEMQKGLIEGINEMRFGQAKIDKMEEMANGYRSFMDERNTNSNVQFLLQTEKVEKKEEQGGDTDETTPPPETRQVGFWERIMNLFAFIGSSFALLFHL